MTSLGESQPKEMMDGNAADGGNKMTDRKPSALISLM